jgi:hypothetical protein
MLLLPPSLVVHPGSRLTAGSAALLLLVLLLSPGEKRGEGVAAVGPLSRTFGSPQPVRPRAGR